MKILLLNPPGKEQYIRDNYCSYSTKAGYLWEPLDLLMLSGILAEHHDIDVIDAIVSDMLPETVCARFQDSAYDAVIMMTGSVSWAEDKELIRALHNVRDALFLVTGDIVLSHGAKLLTDCPELDALILDFANGSILQYFEDPSGGKVIDAFIYRCGGDIIEGNRVVGPPIAMPIPRHDLFPLKHYSISLAMDRLFATTATSFGCSFSCAFCICNLLPISMRTIDSVMDELCAIMGLGVREVFFYDPNFTADKGRVRALCERMARECRELKWFCNVTVQGVDADLIALMRKAGCHTVMMGIESGNDDILKKYKYGLTKQQIRDAVLLFKKAGIRVLGYFLIGLPGETAETMRQTIDFACALPIDAASFNMPAPLPQMGLWKEVHMNDMDQAQGNCIGGDRSMNSSVELAGATKAEVQSYHNYAYKRFYLRPSYLLKQFLNMRNGTQLRNAIFGGWKLMKKYFFK